MKVYLDSSVIIALLADKHQRHSAVIDYTEDALTSGDPVITGQHALAESFNHLSRQRIQPMTGAQVPEGLLGLVATVPPAASNFAVYRKAMQRCTTLGLTGPIVYDAIHHEVALSQNCTYLCTDNVADFTRLRAPADAIAIVTPET